MRQKLAVGDRVKIISMIYSDRWIAVGETAEVITETPSRSFPEISIYRCKMDKDNIMATCTPVDIEVLKG